MKKMIAVAFAMLSTSMAFGSNVYEEYPVVFMGHAVSYDFICQEGNMFRTKKMVDIVETRHGREHDTSVVVGHEYLTTPIHYTRTVSDCHYIGRDRQVCEDKVITGTYPTTVNVKVYKMTNGHGADDKKFLYTKSFTVPQCD